MGYDIHAFTENRPLFLGGVRIEHSRGLDGHSDADVLIHALMDAILGAAGQSDIGHFFPNTDMQYKNCSSMELLQRVMDVIRTDWMIINADTIVIAEEPKVAPYIHAMKDILAKILHVEKTAIGIKATTNETLGAIGRREGIAALANVLLQRRNV